MLKDFTQEKFDIIVQAGQSNSQGCGLGNAANPYEPSDLVWYMNENDTISLAQEKVVGNWIQSNFSLSFAREYLNAGRLEEGRKLLILRAAVGGTGFLDHRWNQTDDLYLHMMEMIRTALALNPENRLVALLWHQGETDAILNAAYEQHYGNLMGLLRSVRETFGVPELPFVAGDFIAHWRDENTEICEPVLRAIRQVCADCGHGGFVETDGLRSNMQESAWAPHNVGEEFQDNIHFSRSSCYVLGNRYFEAFCKCLE